MSGELLNQPGADVRVSVYHFDYNHLEHLCRSTKDPQELLSAFCNLLRPISSSDTIPLAVPPNRKDFSSDEPNGRVGFTGTSGWLYESAIATLKDAAAAPENDMRMLAVFSEGYAPTSTTAQDASDQAIAVGIPVFPVVLDWDLYLQFPLGNMTLGNGVEVQDPKDPSRKLYADVRRQRMLESLGELTGGTAFSTPK